MPHYLFLYCKSFFLYECVLLDKGGKSGIKKEKGKRGRKKEKGRKRARDRMGKNGNNMVFHPVVLLSKVVGEIIVQK